MKKFLLLLVVCVVHVTGIQAQLEDEGQIGWVQSDSKQSYVSFHFISHDGNPAYVKVIGPPSTDPCYIPLDKMSEFRKYLQTIYKEVVKWDKDTLKTHNGDIKERIPIKPVSVCMSTTYNLHYKEDKEIKGPCLLEATWEYYTNEKPPTGSYVAITTEIKSDENPDGYNRFKIWLTLDEINFILKKIINPDEIFKWENHVTMRSMERNRNAMDMNRRLRY